MKSYDYMRKKRMPILSSERPTPPRLIAAARRPRRSDWYIVACPRAARPFDAAAQPEGGETDAAPDRHARAMVRLGLELQRLAGGFRSRQVPADNDR